MEPMEWYTGAGWVGSRPNQAEPSAPFVRVRGNSITQIWVQQLPSARHAVYVRSDGTELRLAVFESAPEATDAADALWRWINDD